jgi:CheY-like chemotaxis protein
MLQPLNPTESSVLLVEDNVDDVMVLTRALGTYGIKRLFVAETAEDGLAHLEQQPCDVAIIDYNPPGMNGLKLVEQAHQRWPNLRIIMVTGVRDDRVAAEAIKVGAFDYVAKDELLTSGIIRSLQVVLRDRADKEVDERIATLNSGPDKLVIAKEEAEWLLETFANDAEMHGFQAPPRSGWDKPDEAWSDAIEKFERYLRACFANFPAPPSVEEENLIKTIALRGLSPRDVIMLYKPALRALAVDGGEQVQPAINPAVCLSRLLARLLESYQQQISLNAYQRQVV